MLSLLMEIQKVEEPMNMDASREFPEILSYTLNLFS